MWKELPPVSIPDLVGIVRARAVQKNDKGVFDADGRIKFIACLCAGAQLQAGTGVWAKETDGHAQDFSWHYQLRAAVYQITC